MNERIFKIDSCSLEGFYKYTCIMNFCSCVPLGKETAPVAHIMHKRANCTLSFSNCDQFMRKFYWYAFWGMNLKDIYLVPFPWCDIGISLIFYGKNAFCSVIYKKLIEFCLKKDISWLFLIILSRMWLNQEIIFMESINLYIYIFRRLFKVSFLLCVINKHRI